MPQRVEKIAIGRKNRGGRLLSLLQQYRIFGSLEFRSARIDTFVAKTFNQGEGRLWKIFVEEKPHATAS